MNTATTTTALTALALLTAAGFAATDPGDFLWRHDYASAFSTDELTVGPDGQVYIADNFRIHALDPDGSPRWTFSYTSNGLREQIEVGPAVGPARRDRPQRWPESARPPSE